MTRMMKTSAAILAVAFVALAASAQAQDQFRVAMCDDIGYAFAMTAATHEIDVIQADASKVEDQMVAKCGGSGHQMIDKRNGKPVLIDMWHDTFVFPDGATEKDGDAVLRDHGLKRIKGTNRIVPIN